MLRLSVLIVPILIALLNLNSIIEAKPYYLQRCIPNLSGENESCKYGLIVDACGNNHCMKGPGDYCGGFNNIYGTCAKGLAYSNCNRCRGCSVKTLKCYEDNCLKILYRYLGKQG